MAHKTDVVVIGGGSIGLNAAYYLQQTGRHVTLIDQGNIGIGSSSGNAGHIVPSHIVPLAAPGMVWQTIKWLLTPSKSPFSMRFSLDPDYISFLLRFSMSCTEENVRRSLIPLKNLGLLSSVEFARVISEEGLDCNYNQSGLLFLYKTKSAWEGGKHEAELLHQNNMPAEILDRDQVRQREPLSDDSVIGGVHFTGDSSLNPGKYLAAIKQRVATQGAVMVENTAVTGLETVNGKITKLVTSQGEFSPEEVVFAAGSWTPILAKKVGIPIPIQPAKGYSLTIKAGDRVPSQALLLGEKRVAITPLGDQIRVTGRLELSSLNTDVDQKKVDGIASAVCDYLKINRNWETLDTWAGLRPTTPDGLPIIERSAAVSNLVIAAGHAMLGLSLGPATGLLVSQLVNGTQPIIDLTGFRSSRF